MHKNNYFMPIISIFPNQKMQKCKIKIAHNFPFGFRPRQWDINSLYPPQKRRIPSDDEMAFQWPLPVPHSFKRLICLRTPTSIHSFYGQAFMGHNSLHWFCFVPNCSGRVFRQFCSILLNFIKWMPSLALFFLFAHSNWPQMASAGKKLGRTTRTKGQCKEWSGWRVNMS